MAPIEVRNALLWSKYIKEAMHLFGDDAEVVFASHHSPWGNDEIRGYLSQQRDLYKYIHDETVRLANHGYVSEEIAVSVVVVALVQGAGISTACPNPDGSAASSSRDFVGQGLGNLGGAFLQSMPTGGSLSRTGISLSGGARARCSRMSARHRVIPTRRSHAPERVLTLPGRAVNDRRAPTRRCGGPSTSPTTADPQP